MTPPDQENGAYRVLTVVRQLVAAIHRGQAPPSVALLSDLERDLGIYSLERLRADAGSNRRSAFVCRMTLVTADPHLDAP